MSNWSTACPDWEERLLLGQSLVPDLPLFQQEAARGVKVFNRLRLADVPGTPRLGPRLDDDPEDQVGDAAGDWFRDIVRALFGSYDRAARRRMIREVFCLVPKKNSKTSYGALLMLTALLLNERPRAPFILTAPVHDTAEMAFNQAEGAIALDPVLEKVLHVRPHLKTIVHRETKAELQIMTFDPSVLTGQKPVGVLIDELHVVAKMAKAASALRQLRGGMLPFPEAFLVTITTQSEDAPAGIFKSELRKARDVRDGKLVAPILPVLYEFPREVQKGKERLWRDSANWYMITPNMDRSIDLARLEEECALAERDSDSDFRAWASQHLNVEIGLALMTESWAGAEYWEQAQREYVTFESLLERCEVVVAGIDGGGLDDLLGLSLLGRERKTRKWLAWHHAWAHKIVLKRREDIAPRLLDFEKEGSLTFVEVPGQDVQEVADLLCKVRSAKVLPAKNAIGVDAVGIGDIYDELISDKPARKFDPDQIIGIQQGWRLNGAIKTTERKLAGNELEVDSSPMMLWCAGNARIEDKGNAVAITKQIAGKAKIDPLMALFNAVTLLALNPAPVRKKSFWEKDHDDTTEPTPADSGSTVPHDEPA